MYVGKSVIFRVLPIVLVYSLIVKIQILYQRIENDYLLQIRLAQNTNLVEQICVMISFLYQLEGASYSIPIGGTDIVTDENVEANAIDY